MAKKTVYPVYNGPNVQFIPGVPAITHRGLTDDEAEALIATGAFTYDKPPPETAEPTTEAPENPGPPDSPTE